MSNNLALRLRSEHEIDLSGKLPDLSNGFTIEAWVCPAPMDGAVRLYPQPGYGGKPVRLKEGLYRSIAGDYLPQFGSASLPEAMEAVFFSEPDFQGESLAIRQDLPQAPEGQQQIGSAVVLDRSHRRQNHVVLFEQPGYQGKAEVLVLPDFWQRLEEKNTGEQATDTKPGLAQIGSAWIPPGVALEVTQLRTSAVAGSSAITIENWTCASPVRTVFIQSADGSVEARAVLNSTSSLPVEWGFNVQAGQPAAIPENNILFLFEKAGYEGKETIMAGKHLGQPSLPMPVGSAIYVAVAGAAGVIGIGPKSDSSGEPQIRFFAVGDPLPADAINWHFWVPPDFCLVPGRDETIPDRIGSGLQACPGSASYIVKRTAATQQGKDTSRMAEGIQRVQRPPDQPKTREGQGIYRLADGRWETFMGPGQSWLQDVPDIAVVDVPKQRALFLFRKPIAQVEAIADYEILADGVFDLSGLTWKPQAAIFVATPHGADGVLSLSHHGQVIPVDRAVRSSAERSVWIPPGFEMIREQREWGSGFHEHIAVAGHRVAQMVRSTLQGDSADFPADARLIKTRRAGPLVGEELVYTAREQPDIEVRASYQFWGSTNEVPDFRTVHVPEGGALFLFEGYFAGSYQGRIAIVTGSRGDLGALSWTPKLAAFAAAPAGPDGILGYQPELRVFAPGTSLPADVSVWFPKGYRVSDRIDPAYLRYISGQPDGSPVGLSLSNVIVERYAGILSSGEGYGLTIERTQSELRGAGDELRFGGELLRPDRWYHLAQTWDSETEILQWYLNGRPVGQAKLSKGDLGRVDSWVLGRSFRGSIAQVRVWHSARTLEQIRDDRYPTTTPAEAPALDLFAQGFDAWQAPPEAVVVSAELPAAPADSVLVKRMQQQVEAENAHKLLAAHQQATAQKVMAHKQAQRKLALAREQARRDIHIQGIKQLGFVRGSGAWFGSLESLTRRVDVLNGVATNLVLGPGSKFYQSSAEAITIDFSGKHARANHEGQVWFGEYWITADGAIGRGWIPPEKDWPDDQQVLFGPSGGPVGRPNYRDIALDADEQILYWTNGWELFWSDVKEDKPERFQVLLPHVASPFPIAVAVAPDGSLLWLDAQDEVVRMLPGDKIKNAIGAQYAEDGVVPGDRIENVLGAAVATLYPAPRPARGLTVSRLADKNGSGKEAAFLYWVASVRRTIEAPVLDTPGRYIDLYHDPKHPHWGQHVAMVAVSGFTGVQWTDATDGSPARLLSFGAAKNSDPPTADQDAQPPAADDVLTFEPIRLDLRRGFTVSADLVWQRVESDPQTAICLYELATFEDEDRIACLIEPDPADGQSGIPTLHLRWDGQVVTGEHQIVSDRRLRIDEQQRVTWMLDRHGVVSTFIEGEKVVEAKISLPDGVRVFEGHALGAPNAAQTHEMIEGALLQRDDARQVFAAFQGRIVRFGAWNCAAPPAAQGWEHTPGPDPTWARSLVTVESKRRYLHAGRLDGQEPPVTLFPIDMDGGLNIETVLDQAHAELTLAHAQKAAAEEQAVQLKAAALQDAHAKLEAATQNLADTQAKAAADVAAAQAQADREKADARTQKANADSTAERDRVQGAQKADQTRADGLKQAQAMETSAADDKRSRIAGANRRYSDAQSRLDEAGD